MNHLVHFFQDVRRKENTRRNVGLDFHQLMETLGVLLSAPNWTTLTVRELNPDHGNGDGSTLRTFCEALAEAIARAPRWRSAAIQHPTPSSD